jgi:hypothetical protein
MPIVLKKDEGMEKPKRRKRIRFGRRYRAGSDKDRKYKSMRWNWLAMFCEKCGSGFIQHYENGDIEETH